VASATVFAFLYLFTTLFWRPVRRALGWLLVGLGQNALYAYSTHILLALAVGVLTVQVTLVKSAGLNAAIQVVSIGLIWLAIRRRILFPNPRNRRLWMASVVPLAVTALVAFGLNSSPVVNVSADGSAETTSASDELWRARAFGTPIPRIAGTTPGMQAAAAPGSAPQTPVLVAAADGSPTPGRLRSAAPTFAISQPCGRRASECGPICRPACGYVSRSRVLQPEPRSGDVVLHLPPAGLR
jgi:hypothetical protein